MDSNSKTKVQEELKKNVTKYFEQLMKGCGRPNCGNEFCASNPKSKKLDPTEAALLSLKLATSNKNLCPPYERPEYFDLETTSSLLEEAKTLSNYTPLIRKIGRVFSKLECLASSFLKKQMEPNDTSLGIDLEEAKKTFHMLEHAPEGAQLMNVLANALERLFSDLKMSAHRLVDAEAVRAIVLSLQTPFLMDNANHKTILLPLCKTILSLPKSTLQIFTNWLKSLNAQQLLQLLGIFQTSITFRVLLPVPVLNTDEIVKESVRMMKLIYDVNEEVNLIPYTDFYNDLVIEKMDLKIDFTNWKGDNGFSFCNYPFILDPAMKSRILQIESLVQQRQQRDEALRQLFMGLGTVPPALVMKIRREFLIQDTLSELSHHDSDDLKKQLRVHFVGEEAIDEGGVQKEWFQLIVREIFDAKYGMFIHNEETHTYWFNSNSADYVEFQLIGMLLGLAIYNGVILDMNFPHVVYKKLMNQSLTLEDLKQTHPSLAIGFQKLLAFEGDVEEIYDRTFQIEYEYFGEKRTYNLKEGGDKIPLTNANREEYVALYVKYLLEDSVAKQFREFLKGFKMVCDSPGFHLFRWEELQLLICGSPVLDFEALEKSTVYDSGFTADHPVIKNFWEVVHSFTLEQKKRLLFFATGSDRSPIGGLEQLNFVITRHGGDSDRLPSAHTCFNHLLLPEYSTKEKLQERLLAAIHNAEGFGML